MVAYNKVDVPDSSDYWEDIGGELLREGVPPEDILAISAATGRGVTELVRRVRVVLDALPAEEEEGEVDSVEAAARRGAQAAAAAVKLAGRRDTDARIGEFAIDCDLAGPRVWFVEGAAIQRFAQMTDWSYYEAALRFQRVLEVGPVGGGGGLRGCWSRTSLSGQRVPGSHASQGRAHPESTGTRPAQHMACPGHSPLTGLCSGARPPRLLQGCPG